MGENFVETAIFLGGSIIDTWCTDAKENFQSIQRSDFWDIDVDDDWSMVYNDYRLRI